MLRSKNLLFILVIIYILSGTSNAQRKVAEEAIIFKEVRDGVFTVFGDEGHGSGFLIDSKGLILTNQHVIENSSHIRVQINDSIKVSGKLLAADDKNDVAVVIVNPSTVEELPTLKLADITNNPPFEGEKVIAIGSPLHQQKILTSGLISKVLETAVVSDVNLNPGNSGGPLINMDGEVIAINTFVDPGRGTPGVSGSILITQASNLIEKAKALSDSITPPQATLLPVMPKTFYPLSALEDAASLKKRDSRPYNVAKLTKTGNFNMLIATPPYLYRAEKQYELELLKKRKEREEKGKVGKGEAYTPFKDLKEWAQHLGRYSPTITFLVVPKIGETGGSKFWNFLGAVGAGLSGSYYYGSHVYEFKADLKDFRLLVNGLESPEINRAMIFQPLDILSSDFYGTYEAKDLARLGLFVFPYEIFQPINGKWPEISVDLVSIDKPSDTTVVNLPRQTMEQVWSDFEPYREQIIADTTKLVIDH